MTLGRDLAYVALVARDADLAARVLGRDLDLRRSDLDDGLGHRMPVFSIGESALVSPDTKADGRIRHCSQFL